MRWGTTRFFNREAEPSGGGRGRASFEVRNVAFEMDASIPRYWHGGRRAVTLFFDNLSTLFPLGERFFMQSVTRFLPKIDDPALRAEIRAFTGQEGIHTREHLAYNELLERHGHDIAALEEGIAKLLEVPKVAGPLRDEFSLAATIALEHWTAILAHFVLEDDRVLHGAHPVLAGLWRWHAAEECEHKAVAYDVYERVSGSYPLRVGVQLLASVLFWGRTLQQQHRLMQEDGIADDLAEWADLARFLFVEQRVFQRLAPIWLEYFERDFHPWHMDDSHLIARWLDDYETNPVYQKRVRRPPRVHPPLSAGHEGSASSPESAPRSE
jgi:predicted metal-dependent hydrolase